MPFTYHRTVRLSDTDAAGVVYFAQVLSMCHEAYEESLAASGINLKAFFNNSSTAIPIAYAEIDFFKPMFVGDRLIIEVSPQPLSDSEFVTAYRIVNDSSSGNPLAKAKTRHVCIRPGSRRRNPLPETIRQWLMLL